MKQIWAGEEMTLKKMKRKRPIFVSEEQCPVSSFSFSKYFS